MLPLQPIFLPMEKNCEIVDKKLIKRVRTFSYIEAQHIITCVDVCLFAVSIIFASIAPPLSKFGTNKPLSSEIKKFTTAFFSLLKSSTFPRPTAYNS